MSYKIINKKEKPSRWKKITLGDLLYIKGRIGWKGLRKDEYLKEGYPILNGDNIKNDTLNFNNLGRISKDRFDESPEIILKENDILMTKDGTIGKIAYVSELEEPTTIASGLFLIRCIDKRIYPRYLWYIFQSNLFKNFIKERVEGSVIPHLYQRDFEEFKILLPSLDEQKEMVKILELIDKKIQTNRKLNQVLVNIAKTLYKSWFIKFEPVKELTENKSIKNEAVLKNLFPDKYENSEFGNIPKGWEIVTLGEVLTFIGSGMRPDGGASITEDQVPSIGAENIEFLGNYNFDKEKFIPREFYNELKKKDVAINDYDILIYKDGANIGRSTIFGKGFPHKECTINEHVHLIRSNDILQKYLYFVLSSKKYQQKLISLNTGSAQPGINQSQLKTLKILKPNKEVLIEFNKIVSPVVDLIFTNSLEINFQSKFKSILKSKIFSGELIIFDDEKLIQETWI